MKIKATVCGLLFLPLFLSGQNKTAESQSDPAIVLDSVIIEGNRATAKTPIPFTELNRQQIRSQAATSSIPLILNLQPSVVSTTEGGTGLGYTKMSVRGSDVARINVTLNGVAMNDSESQEVFWVNIPALSSFLQSIQLQRGVGTSVNGPGAFGASINMQTLYTAPESYGEAQWGFGSYNTFISSVGAGSGLMKNGLSFDIRISRNTTDGYIRNAYADVLSLFATVGYKRDKNSFRLNYILGDQVSGITWEGIPGYMLNVDRKYNPAGEYFDDAGNVRYYDNETDNYRQHYLQAIYTHQFSSELYWVNTLNFTKGDGYYENYKKERKFSSYGLEEQLVDGISYKKSDVIIRQAMDNAYYAASSILRYRTVNRQASLGLNYSQYDGDHFGYLIWSKYNQNIQNNHQWYLNNGFKRDVSIFIKYEDNLTDNLSLYADIQYRYLDYRLSGMDKDFAGLDKDMRYDFINPKVGINWKLNDKNRLYASFSVGHKEPGRGDIKEAIKAGRAEQMLSERLFDWEFGYCLSGEIFSLNANIYLMEYKDQLVQTGKISETGYGIKENVPVSFRRGVEVTGGLKVHEKLQLDANITLSVNKIKEYTAWVDTFDQEGNSFQTQEYYENTTITMSPSIISMGMLTYTPFTNASVSLNAKYVGKQYYDNTGNEERSLPAYFVMGLNSSYRFKIKNSSWLELSLFVDNLLNNKYLANAWIYRAIYTDGSDPYIEDGFFPQAGRNFMLKLTYTF